MTVSILAFEKLALALQTDRDTINTTPDRLINAAGTITPQAPTANAPISDGTLAERSRAQARAGIPRRWADWEVSGELDVNDMIYWASMGLQSGVSPTTPGGGTLSRNWAYTRTMSANTLDVATLWGGDPNWHMMRAEMCFLSEMAIEADGSGTNNVSFTASGQGKFPVVSGQVEGATKANPVVITSTAHGLKTGDEVTFYSVAGMTDLNGNSYTVANPTANSFELDGEDGSAFGTLTVSDEAYWVLDPPTFPAQDLGDVISPLDIQVWIDSTSNIGTTAVTGKVVRVSHTIPTGLTPKFIPSGPGGGRTISRVDPGKVSPSMSLAMEVSPAHYNLFSAGKLTKVRVRYNGPVIEGSLYYYVQADLVGYLEELSMDELEGVNRLYAFTMYGVKHSELGNSDIKLVVQNTKTAL